jgi:hypothetical protein
MNLFFLHDDAREAARLQSDVHVVKMILETMQMLCTALYHCLNPIVFPVELYKPTHVNHPSTKWIRHSPENFMWALQHGHELCLEYTRRYNKIHKCQHLYDILRTLPELNFKKLGIKNYDTKKLAFYGIPSSVKFVAIAIADEIFKDCAVYNSEGNLLAIPTYKKYYLQKTKTLKRSMKWYKKEDIPQELYDNPSKKRKLETNILSTNK